MSKGKESIEAKFLAEVNKHRAIIYKVARTYTSDPDDQKDLFQEILLQLWRSFSTFKGQSSFSTWMYRISLNTAITGIRKKNRQPQIDNFDGVVAQLEEGRGEMEVNERKELLWKAIHSLSQVEKAIVVLYLEEYAYEEIAEMVGISVNYVGVKINRIKKKLKEKLTPHLT